MARVQGILPFGPFDSGEPNKLLSVSKVRNCAEWSSANRNRGITFRVLKQDRAIYSIKLYTLSKTAYVCYLLLKKTKSLAMEHKVTTYMKVLNRSRAPPDTPN